MEAVALEYDAYLKRIIEYDKNLTNDICIQLVLITHPDKTPVFDMSIIHHIRLYLGLNPTLQDFTQMTIEIDATPYSLTKWPPFSCKHVSALSAALSMRTLQMHIPEYATRSIAERWNYLIGKSEYDQIMAWWVNKKIIQLYPGAGYQYSELFDNIQFASTILSKEEIVNVLKILRDVDVCSNIKHSPDYHDNIDPLVRTLYSDNKFPSIEVITSYIQNRLHNKNKILGIDPTLDKQKLWSDYQSMYQSTCNWDQILKKLSLE